SAASGVTMACHTTEPGLQVYDGAHIDIDLPGLDGRSMGAYAGLAMEPQVWPDAHHHKHFPQAVLRPGETYNQHTQFVFSKGET
ncbi:MAG: galactose-1-epimerase, partial [Shimia sp.]|nr:galactose-1-epimerase [Shimia sp.]